MQQEARETYLTYRISDHFLLKGSYINYNYALSGSGLVGATKRLSSTPLLGLSHVRKCEDVHDWSDRTVLRTLQHTKRLAQANPLCVLCGQH